MSTLSEEQAPEAMEVSQDDSTKKSADDNKAMEVIQVDSTKKNTDENNSTFKTPSFIIPSKKKVQSNTNASDAFKSPPVPMKPASKTADSPDAVKNDDKAKSDSESKEPESDKVKEKPPEKKSAALSPAERLKQTQTAVPYLEPPWSSLCEDKFSFEVIKNGAVIDNIDLTTKAYHIIGRLPSCDIPMEHPSLSRHHAVIQYSGGSSEEFPAGWYLYDLDSTHGTWINKNKVPSQKYHKIHVDYVLKFGGSTRLFILQGPDTDRQEESELSATEMKEQREKQLKEAELLRQAEIEEAERKAEIIKQREESKGCSWGIDEDDAAEEEDENAENPFAAIEPENEALYINDPKKSLNGYFEREGLELPEYEFHDAGFGKWKCTIELPIDAPNGEPIVAEVVVSGKKREAVVACALEACRILDRHGELRKSAQESRKRKQRNWEDDDFYDSDDDVYLDRTGAIEKKRQLRKEKIGKKEQSAQTYDSLLEKHKGIESEIQEIEAKLEQAKAQAAAMDSDDVDALDAYMNAIKSGMMDTKTKMKFKRQLMELKQEEQKIRKLVNIAKPASLPELKLATKEAKPAAQKPSLLSSTGKIKGPVPGKILPKKVVLKQKMKNESESSEDVEMEDDDDTETSDNKESMENNPENEIKNITDENISESQAEPISELVEPKLEKASVKPRENTSGDTKNSKPSEKQTTSKRSKGHSLPLAAVLEQLQEEVDANNEGGKKGRKNKSGTSAVDDGGYNVEDPDYAVWLPPQNQTGDGKTHLNKKLGY